MKGGLFLKGRGLRFILVSIANLILKRSFLGFFNRVFVSGNEKLVNVLSILCKCDPTKKGDGLRSK